MVSLLINPLLSELQADLYRVFFTGKERSFNSPDLSHWLSFPFACADARGKAKGKENRRGPAEPARKPGQVIDLMQAVRQSLGAAPAEKKGAKKASRATATKKRKKAS